MAVGAPRVLGLVLAGGRSTRWGSEKAVAVVGGAPMIARVAAALARGCDAVSVNARSDSGAAAWAGAHGLEVLPDPPDAPAGPLAGVLAGLEAAEARGCPWLLTAPCDTPGLPADLCVRLLAGVGEAAAATAVTAEGSHPLCTLWSVALRPRLAAALAEGTHPSVRDWLRDVGATAVRFGEPRAFANLNTPPRRVSPLRAVGGVASGLVTAFVFGIGTQVALGLWAQRYAPHAFEGGDMSPLFLPAVVGIPLASIAAGAAVAAAVILRGPARRT